MSGPSAEEIEVNGVLQYVEQGSGASMKNPPTLARESPVRTEGTAHAKQTKSFSGLASSPERLIFLKDRSDSD
jgi:hypothetical protein